MDDVERVRATLLRMAEPPEGSVSRLSRESGIPHMTLKRFLFEGTMPQPAGWNKIVAYVETLSPPTPLEAKGMLRVVSAMRRELDALEAEAWAATAVAKASAKRTATAGKSRARGRA